MKVLKICLHSPPGFKDMSTFPLQNEGFKDMSHSPKMKVLKAFSKMKVLKICLHSK